MNLQFMTHKSQEVLRSLRESSQAMAWRGGGVKAELCSVSRKRGDALAGGRVESELGSPGGVTFCHQ